MKVFLKKLFSYAIIILFYACSFVMYLIKKFKKTTITHTRNRSPSNFTHFAIFAVYCNTLTNNHKTILRKLSENGYFIILANNGKTELSEIRKTPVDLYIEHPNTGSDFGLYQYASQWLYENANVPDNGQVLYMNDSIFYLEKRSPHLFETIAKLKKDCIGMTEATLIQYHMTAWLFALAGKVFKNKEIKKFWDRYLPLKFRQHCIRKGEVKLTSTILKAGYTPYIFYPASYFIKKIHCQKEKELTLFPQNDFYRKLFNSFIEKQIPLKEISLKDNDEIILNSLRDLSAGTNQMHFFNLNGVRFCSFPFLKKDLFWRDIYSLAQIRSICDYLKSAGEDESDEILHYYMKRGNAHQTLPFLKLALFKRGLI
ncbi:MAG: hypothetical protein JSR85_01605 [Proteobacteria bacterium]|nr:hypothetical protein [Pseudomonadota bacterium]